jgi:hypothetical protein
MTPTETLPPEETLELRNHSNMPISEAHLLENIDPPLYVLISEQEYEEWQTLAKRAADLLVRVMILEKESQK